MPPWIRLRGDFDTAEVCAQEALGGRKRPNRRGFRRREEAFSDLERAHVTAKHVGDAQRGIGAGNLQRHNDLIFRRNGETGLFPPPALRKGRRDDRPDCGAGFDRRRFPTLVLRIENALTVEPPVRAACAGLNPGATTDYRTRNK